MPSGPTVPARLTASRTSAAIGWLIVAAIALGAGDQLATEGNGILALVALIIAVPCAGMAWHGRSMARRARTGARADRLVRAAMAPLARSSWRIQNSVSLEDGGDLAHVAFSPAGAAFVIATKPGRHSSQDLQSVRDHAVSTERRYRPAGGCYAVLVVARGVSRCQIENGVIVCTVDRLVDALASTSTHGQPLTGLRPASVLTALGRLVGA